MRAAVNAFGVAIHREAVRRPSRHEEEVVALYRELRAPVLRYLISCRIPSPDAEEIVQEVFLLLFRHLRNEAHCDNPQGWVFRAAHNFAMKHRTRTQRYSERFAELPSAAEFADRAAPDPEAQMRDLQERQRLMAVVRALPEQDQCCLSLRAEGLRYREIAEVLGMSLGAVANSLERSLARLARAGELLR